VPENRGKGPESKRIDMQKVCLINRGTTWTNHDGVGGRMRGKTLKRKAEGRGPLEKREPLRYAEGQELDTINLLWTMGKGNGGIRESSSTRNTLSVRREKRYSRLYKQQETTRGGEIGG